MRQQNEPRVIDGRMDGLIIITTRNKSATADEQVGTLTSHNITRAPICRAIPCQIGGWCRCNGQTSTGRNYICQVPGDRYGTGGAGGIEHSRCRIDDNDQQQ